MKVGDINTPSSLSLYGLTFDGNILPVTLIDKQKARGPVARPKHGRHSTTQARHGPEDTGPGLGTARVPGRAWAARQARRVARHGPQLVEGTVEAR